MIHLTFNVTIVNIATIYYTRHIEGEDITFGKLIIKTCFMMVQSVI